MHARRTHFIWACCCSFRMKFQLKLFSLLLCYLLLRYYFTYQEICHANRMHFQHTHTHTHQLSELYVCFELYVSLLFHFSSFIYFMSTHFPHIHTHTFMQSHKEIHLFLIILPFMNQILCEWVFFALLCFFVCFFLLLLCCRRAHYGFYC